MNKIQQKIKENKKELSEIAHPDLIEPVVTAIIGTALRQQQELLEVIKEEVDGLKSSNIKYGKQYRELSSKDQKRDDLLDDIKSLLDNK